MSESLLKCDRGNLGVCKGTFLKNSNLSTICCGWIWDERNAPKIGGCGEVVEMDESFFPRAPKHKRGRRLGTTSEEAEKAGIAKTDDAKPVQPSVS